MKPFELLGEAVLPDGTAMKLTRRGDEFFMLAGGVPLMSSRMHGSEEALATLACQRARAMERPSVLIGGLGMGFTLRAALDVLPQHATIVVAELVPAVVEWNHGPLTPLGPLAGNPLSDKRVRVEIADVANILNSAQTQFDAVILDVDNGPSAFTTAKNASLYSQEGIATLRHGLKSDGILTVWAVQRDPKFVQRLQAAGFETRTHHVRGHAKDHGPRHTIYVAKKSSARSSYQSFRNSDEKNIY